MERVQSVVRSCVDKCFGDTNTTKVSVCPTWDGGFVVKYFKCKKCANLSVGPSIEGVEIICGAFSDYEILDAQDALDHGVRPTWDKGLKLGGVRMNSVQTCGGEMKEISFSEMNTVVDEMTDKIKFNGVRDKR